MSRKCELTGKAVMTGNNVSHANNKTKRKFLPNLQAVSLYSEKLSKKIKFKVAISTLRTVEKKGGIDNFLIKSKPQDLSSSARKYKKDIEKN
jgi:large subunit ribosomal protein L28